MSEYPDKIMVGKNIYGGLYVSNLDTGCDYARYIHESKVVELEKERDEAREAFGEKSKELADTIMEYEEHYIHKSKVPISCGGTMDKLKDSLDKYSRHIEQEEPILPSGSAEIQCPKGGVHSDTCQEECEYGYRAWLACEHRWNENKPNLQKSVARRRKMPEAEIPCEKVNPNQHF